MGHRGLTHSLLFALWVGLFAASLTFRRFRVSFWSLSALFFVIVASHGLLDAMTRGVPIPFFWPLADRYGNWGVTPMPDLGFGLPDPRRSRALRAEMLLIWLPTAVLVGAVMVARYLYRSRKAPDGSATAKAE